VRLSITEPVVEPTEPGVAFWFQLEVDVRVADRGRRACLYNGRVSASSFIYRGGARVRWLTGRKRGPGPPRAEARPPVRWASASSPYAVGGVD
jgi:hypothetical protein